MMKNVAVGLLGLALVHCGGLALAQAGGTPAATSNGSFYVITLGTGIPLPNPARGTAATLVVAGDRTVLVDTGRRAMENLVATGRQSADIVVFTHFHSDHIADFGEYMMNRGVAGVGTPQRVYGPAGVQSVVDNFLKLYSVDTGYRVAHHGVNWPPNAMKADVKECAPGVILDESGLKITMFDVDHEPIVPAVGYKFEFGGKSIVISGDTKPTPKMAEMAKGADILVHEAMNTKILSGVRNGMRTGNPRMGQMLEDLMNYHSGTLEVAAIARDAGVKKLVLTHLVPSIQPTDAAEKAFIQGMSDVYSGPIVVARDGMKIQP